MSFLLLFLIILNQLIVFHVVFLYNIMKIRFSIVHCTCMGLFSIQCVYCHQQKVLHGNVLGDFEAHKLKRAHLTKGKTIKGHFLCN